MNLLLVHYPFFDVIGIDWQRDDPDNPGPWVLVELGQPSEVGEAFAVWQFAIWKRTGAVHSLDREGRASDDPIFTPE